jgi:hypothetical protein
VFLKHFWTAKCSLNEKKAVAHNLLLSFHCSAHFATQAENAPDFACFLRQVGMDNFTHSKLCGIAKKDRVSRQKLSNKNVFL